MVITVNEFILASQSPRRRELLNAIGLNFEVIVSDADESSVSPEGIAPGMYVQELAMLKGAAAAKFLRERGRKKAIVISADTVVAADGKILGKPKDEEEAFAMLSALSGREHEVYTGICVMRLLDGFSVADSVKTSVWFNELSEDKIRRYIKSGEPMDKAGAYGIQGKGAVLVKQIDGDYFNVVGLPLSRLAQILENDFEKTV